jgi:hypothetical protein
VIDESHTAIPSTFTSGASLQFHCGMWKPTSFLIATMTLSKLHDLTPGVGGDGKVGSDAPLCLESPAFRFLCLCPPYTSPHHMPDIPTKSNDSESSRPACSGKMEVLLATARGAT